MSTKAQLELAHAEGFHEGALRAIEEVEHLGRRLAQEGASRGVLRCLDELMTRMTLIEEESLDRIREWSGG